MRYHVRNAEGEELVVPSLPDLHALYAQGFLGPADLVRKDSSDAWVPCGVLLRGAARRAPAARLPGRATWAALAAAVALAAALGILFALR